MKRMGWSLVAGAGIAGLLVASPLARAGDDSSKSSPTSSQTQSGQSGMTGTGSSSDKGSSASTATPSHKNQLTGKIQKYDRDNKTLTLDNSDKKLKLGDRTQVMKNGASASASDLHEGDQVRASYAEPPTAGAFDVVVIEVIPADTGTSTGTPSGGSTGTGTGATQGGSTGEKSSGSYGK
jgi:hypothetical protein